MGVSMTEDIQIIDLYDNTLGSYYSYPGLKKVSFKDINIARIVSIVSTIALILGIFVFYQNVKASSITQNLDAAVANVKVLYQDSTFETPNLGITLKDINRAKTSVSKITDLKTRTYYLNLIQGLYKFEAVKTKLYNYFDEDDVVLSSITEESVLELENLIMSLPTKHQKLLTKKYDELLGQYTNLENAKSSLKNLFSDTELTIVRDNVTIEELDFVERKFSVLSQTDEIEKSKPYLETVRDYIQTRERKEELERAYVNAIANANVEISGIPYISQTANKVYNGCEAASLLMALKSKGFAQNYDLVTFANAMPKHESDPHQGFVNSIFDVAPLDVAHWIAPDALASFGSRFATTKNISGSSVDDIKQYLDNGIPVIIYGTYKFEDVKTWSGEVPLNLHVMLATGYNKITGNVIINDPWSGKITVEKDKFEKIYNVLKYAVIVE